QEAIHQLAMIEYNKSRLSEKYKNELLISQNSSQEAQILIQRILLGVVLLSLFILLGFLYTLNKKKKQIKSLHEGLSRNYSAMENVNQVLKTQEEELKDTLMNKDRFVSILGHDLKNPFSGLLGLLELMDSDWEEMKEQDKKDGIQMLYQSSVQTYKLLEDLLDWGKTQQGIVQSEPEKIDVAKLLNSVVAIFNLQIKKKNLSIQLYIPEGAMIFSDLKLSSQIIQNFVGNAIKYTHKGGQVLLKVESKNKDYKISVIDKGIGIPADKIGSLFSLNSNFNRPGTNREKSTGMGLILCQEYAKIIGGVLSVESNEGKGSTFSLIVEKA
ncbi:MAG: hypothetical protein GQ527_10830, partial [Bacteroidales bacterium]|nr:hypothetical protein [Bacteroidales bacterium]